MNFKIANLPSTEQTSAIQPFPKKTISTSNIYKLGKMYKPYLPCFLLWLQESYNNVKLQIGKQISS